MMNAVRTTFLLATLTGLFMAVGFVVGGQFGMFLALGFSLITNLLAYWNADKIVLRLQHAELIGRARAPELHNMVTGLASRAGIPVPQIYLIHSVQPNAFATGRNPQNAAVAVSTGLLDSLEPSEVAAVIAHELAHIRSHDTLTMTITATLAGAISMLAQFGLFFGGRNANSPLGPIGTLAMIILAPLAAMMVQMAVSRTREYEADRIGAEITGDPLALASALAKISRLAKNFENPFARRHPGLAHLFIVNPLEGDRMDSLFSTHPDVQNRIKALQDMAIEMGKSQRRIRQQKQPFARRRHGGGWRVPEVGNGEQQRGPWG